MSINIASRHLGEIVVLKPDVFPDNRGIFMVSYQKEFLNNLGLPSDYHQDNISRSVKNVIRGLHFQWDPPMGKLMTIVVGRAYLVAVDIRKYSPTLGQYYGMEISSEDPRLIWAPAGFARGLCALSDEVILHYKCTNVYNREGESCIRWDDPDIGIKWPIERPTLSTKDANAQSFRSWLESPLSDIF